MYCNVNVTSRCMVVVVDDDNAGGDIFVDIAVVGTAEKRNNWCIVEATKVKLDGVCLCRRFLKRFSKEVVAALLFL